MVLLPYHRITIKTDLKPGDVQERLLEIVDIPKNVWEEIFKGYGVKMFKGELNHDEFRIIRRTWSKNFFLPMIHGRILREHSETLINIKLRLRAYDLIFCIIWICLTGLGGIAESQKANSEAEQYILFIMAISFILVYLFSFNYEIYRVRKAFTKLFTKQN